jgi:hypothetical protein
LAAVTLSGADMKHLVNVFMSVVALLYLCPTNNVREQQLTRRGTKNFLTLLHDAQLAVRVACLQAQISI